MIFHKDNYYLIIILMKRLYFLAILWLLQIQIYAGDSTTIVDNFLDDFKTGVKKSVSFFTAPFNFSGEEWIYTGVLATGTVLLFTLDQELESDRETIFSKNPTFQKIIGGYGDVDYANIFSIGLYTAGLLTGEDEIRRTGRLLIESLFISGSTALLLRVITGRPRPYMNEGSAFKWFETDLDYQSFPSGHTTVVFAVSTVLAERIDNGWARAGFYSLAAVAALERSSSSDHWFSDVILGGILGYGSAMFVLHQEDLITGLPADISFYPSVSGLNLLWRL